jgi:predicted DsbA family dithiol-disulfide isomerase/rhodanese-related sulfurtransferase/uncharacterized membrane protein
MRKLTLLSLSLVGLFDAAFLWWMYASPSVPMVCTGSGCDAVRASSYSHFQGIPTPAFGVTMFAVLTLLVFVGPLVTGRWGRKLSYLIAAITGAGFLVSLYLTGIEAFVLHNWCDWCLLSAVTVTVMFVISLLELFRPSPDVEGGAALAALRGYVTVVMLAILAGVPAFIFLTRANAHEPAPQASREALREHLIRPDSHVFGDPNSPVTVVEFSDFQCPFCGRAEKTVKKIREAYNTRIRFVFRQFPLPTIHAFAEKAAEASECAAEQGDFWQAYEKLYANQDDLSVPALEHYASGLGLNRARFEQCLSSGAMAFRVRQDVEDGRALGVSRTPTFFIDGKKYEGAPSYDQFAEILNAELAAHGMQEAPQRAATAGSEGPAHPANKQTANAKPREKTESPASETASSAGFLGGSSAAGMFFSGDNPLAGCSEEEANQEQPALIDTAQARRMYEDGSKALFVDVRSPADFQKARIRGAVNVPLNQLESRWTKLPKDRSIVFYENGGAADGSDACAFGRAAGRFLLTHGFSFDRVKVYHEGLKGWEKAGLPVASGQASGS